jgi:hypothetical protein
MLNTSPPPPPRERETATLLEDLCVALRDVGVFDGYLPAGAQVLKAIDDVRAFHDELIRRGVDPADRIRELSHQTRWRMEDLLRDCLRYPEVVPYVRETDDVRRHLRCTMCRRAERPPDDQKYWLCGGCLHRLVRAIDAREPFEGVVLFRTYNPTSRCEHADADTVLALIGWDEVPFGYCRRCFELELERRRGEAL